MTKKLLIGLVPLLAVAAFAMAPSAALAGEYGRCVASPGTGGYENAGCTEVNAEHEGEYEWKAGPGVNPGYTSTTGEAKLKSGLGTVVCTASTDVGKITGVTTDEDTVTFTTCTLEGKPCQSVGAAAGTIKTNLLDTSLIDYPNGPAENEVWTKFVSPSGPTGYQAEFECPVVVEGIGELPTLFRVSGSLSGVTTAVNVMATTSTTEFENGKGEQALKLEYNVAGTGWAGPIPSEEITTGTTTYEEEIEVRA